MTTVASEDSEIVFYDTSKALKGNLVYAYAIQSENSSGRISLFSDTVYIRPNITITLSPPLDLKGSFRDSVVQLYWENIYILMPSLDGYRIYRKENGSAKDFQPLFDSLISAKQNNFIDSSILIGKSYEYAVQSVDIYGNKSTLSSSLLIQGEPIIVLPPAGIKAQKSGDGILISWDEPVRQNIKDYKIYRYERGKEVELISSVSIKEKPEYLDKNITAGNLYFYFLKSVDTTNAESSPSKEVAIRF
jgi:fibronectin type 3 domain-containing protein